MTTPITVFEEALTKELEARICHGFREHAINAVSHDGGVASYAFVAKDQEQVVGAVIVKTFWGALHIKHLWVAPAYQGQGIGKSLMAKALEKGCVLNCSFAYVETLSFQALDFYKKLGFTEDFVRHGYAQGTAFHYLQKSL